jgi:hypothetical protein
METLSRCPSGLPNQIVDYQVPFATKRPVPIPALAYAEDEFTWACATLRRLDICSRRSDARDEVRLELHDASQIIASVFESWVGQFGPLKRGASYTWMLRYLEHIYGTAWYRGATVRSRSIDEYEQFCAGLTLYSRESNLEMLELCYLFLRTVGYQASYRRIQATLQRMRGSHDGLPTAA